MDTHLNTVVSGALDRLHYEKDPCVKYDTTRKIWIYLHRNRTEEEFGEYFHLNIVYASYTHVHQIHDGIESQFSN